MSRRMGPPSRPQATGEAPHIASSAPRTPLHGETYAPPNPLTSLRGPSGVDGPAHADWLLPSRVHTPFFVVRDPGLGRRGRDIRCVSPGAHMRNTQAPALTWAGQTPAVSRGGVGGGPVELRPSDGRLPTNSSTHTICDGGPPVLRRCIHPPQPLADTIGTDPSTPVLVARESELAHSA